MNLAKFSEIFDKKKTFRPKKKFQPGTMKYSLHKQAQASLNSGINLRQVVKLPKGEDFNDWLAVHVVDFFNRINLIYGTVCEQVNYFLILLPTICLLSVHERELPNHVWGVEVRVPVAGRDQVQEAGETARPSVHLSAHGLGGVPDQRRVGGSRTAFLFYY